MIKLGAICLLWKGTNMQHLVQDTYRINMSDWGSAMNEMEVLAWASVE